MTCNQNKETFMKYLILIISTSVLMACEEPPAKNYTINNVDTFCIKGVLYYSRHHKMAPAFKQDGSLYLCGEL